MQDPSLAGDASTVTTALEQSVGSLSADVDVVEATLWLVVITSVTLDVYTTSLGLSVGLTEGNPVMHWAIDGFGIAALAVAKLLVVAGAGLLREARPRYGPAIALGLAVPWVLTVLVNAVTLATL